MALDIIVVRDTCLQSLSIILTVWLLGILLCIYHSAFFICKTEIMTATNRIKLLGELDLGNVCKTLICKMDITTVPTSLGYWGS